MPCVSIFYRLNPVICANVYRERRRVQLECATDALGRVTTEALPDGVVEEDEAMRQTPRIDDGVRCSVHS